MGLQSRIDLYKKIEAYRKKPLIVYVTSTRPQALGFMAQDVITEMLTQLHALPKCDELDFFVSSNGGDPTVAWRIVSLLREKVKKFSILIPQAAYSAATLIALGADEIVMHPYGNLGPTDPQIDNFKKDIKFGSEDVQAFLRFAREEVGLTDQESLRDLFLKLSEEVGFTSIGVAARSSQLSVSIGEKMLHLHMKEGEARTRARSISEALNSKYFHHGYPLSRTEAKEIGLSVADTDQTIEDLMWAVWKDLEADLKIREAFVPLGLFSSNPACQALFSPIRQQQNAQVVPPTPFDYTACLMESCRCASRYQVAGRLFAGRQADLEIKIQIATEKMGWIDVPMPMPAPGLGAAANVGAGNAP